MHNFSFTDGRAATLALPTILWGSGERVAPRGQATRELRDVVIEINDPTRSMSTGINRKMNTSLAVMESLQLIGGFSDAPMVCDIAPNMQRFTNNIGEFDGAYGPRVGKQMQTVINRLRSDPDTRQAIVTIWDPELDLFEGSKDYPCTIGFTFSIRQGQLLMSTHMRSNDIWWGWTYDVVQFTQLQCTVANILGLPAGPYTHFVNSLHMYERDADAAFALDYPTDQPMNLHGIGVSGMSWAAVSDLAFHLTYVCTAECADLPSNSTTEMYFAEKMSYWR